MKKVIALVVIIAILSSIGTALLFKQRLNGRTPLITWEYSYTKDKHCLMLWKRTSTTTYSGKFLFCIQGDEYEKGWKERKQ